MSIFESIEKIFNEKGINYFKGNNLSKNIFNIPYIGIQDKQTIINIYLDVDEALRVLKFTFVEKVNKSNNDVDIKTKLLDINSSLNFGNLSMRSDSDTVEYRVDYQLNDEDFSFNQYNKFIIRCINVYEKLKEEKLI